MLIGWHVKIAKIGILMHKIVKEKLNKTSILKRKWFQDTSAVPVTDSLATCKFLHIIIHV